MALKNDLTLQAGGFRTDYSLPVSLRALRGLIFSFVAAAFFLLVFNLMLGELFFYKSTVDKIDNLYFKNYISAVICRIIES